MKKNFLTSFAMAVLLGGVAVSCNGNADKTADKPREQASADTLTQNAPATEQAETAEIAETEEQTSDDVYVAEDDEALSELDF